MKNLVISATVASVLAACASAPPRSDPLERARTEVQTLAQDPLTQQAAAADLRAVRADLDQADTALQKKQPQAAIDHLAYLAERNAQAGEARVQAARAHADVARAKEERGCCSRRARVMRRRRRHSWPPPRRSLQS